MSKIKVAILEDEFIISQDISSNLLELGYEVSGIYESGTEAIAGLKRNPADILLMDIHIKGGIDGIETAEIIRDTVDIPFIYVTAYSDQATMERAKKTMPHAFIVKPFNFKNLTSSIELAIYNFSRNTRAGFDDAREIPKIDEKYHMTRKVIFIKEKGSLEKVGIKDIKYIEAKGSYCDIITSGKKYTLSQNLQNLLERLDSETFIRVHRSHAVNINCIDSIEEDQVLVNGHKIPMSKASKQELLNRIKSI